MYVPLRSYVHLISLHAGNLLIQEVARRVNVADRLLADTLALITRRGKVGCSVKRTRSVSPGSGSRKLSTRKLDVVLVLGKLILVCGGLNFARLDLNVEVGNVLRVELLAIGTNDLVAEVLLEVRLNVVGVQRSKLAVGLLFLKGSSDGNATLDKSRGGTVATASDRATEEAVRTDVTGIESVLELAGSVSSGTVDGLSSGNSAVDHASREVSRSGTVGRLSAEEAVHLVRSRHSVLVTNDRKNSVVVTSLERTARVDGGSILVVTLLHLTLAHAVEPVHGPDDVLTVARLGLRVVVTEDTGLLDIVGGVGSAAVILLEGNQRSVGIVDLTGIPLSHVAVDSSRHNISVGDDGLVHGEETVNVGVVEPEERIESSDVEVAHVSISATDSAVDIVVDGLEAVSVTAARLDTESSGGSITPGLLAGEECKNTLAPPHAGLAEDGVYLVVVAASGVRDGTTKSSGETVAWAPSHLAGKRVAPSVRVERVTDGNLTLGLGHTDGLVADRSGNSRLSTRRLSSPVIVGDTKAAKSVLPPCLLVARERGDHFLSVQVHSLLRDVRRGFQTWHIQHTS